MRAMGSREEDEEDEADEEKEGEGEEEKAETLPASLAHGCVTATLLRTDSLLPRYVRVSKTGRTGRKS